MAWVRLSDDFYDHPKFSEAGALGIALFATGLAWCNRNLTDGFIPRKTAVRLLDFEDAVDAARNGDRNGVTNGASNGHDNDALTLSVARNVIRTLVRVGLWEEVEGGYQVHDYLDYQASKAQIEAGRESNAARQKAWRERRKTEKRNGDRNGVTNGASNATVTGAPNPNPNPTEEDLRSSSSSEKRDDVERLCGHLADCIQHNGSKRPTITKRWRDSARLLLDKDGRTEEQIHAAIDWCQNHEFWRGNVLSMPKLREKYDTLRLQAQRENAIPRIGKASDSTWRGGGAHDQDIVTAEQIRNKEVEVRI